MRTTTAAATGTGAWQQLSVTSAATSGGTSLCVEVTVSLPKNVKANVDDVSLKRN